MFRSFTVKNFRCFRELTLAPLERINLIAGKNNTGKTALLEAIHLHCHPAGCDLAVNINKARGITNPVQDVQGVIISWLLWQGQPLHGGLEVSSQDDGEIDRTLTMWLLDFISSRARFPEQEKSFTTSFGMTIGEANYPRIILRFQQAGDPDRLSIAVTTGSGFYWLPANIPWKVTSIFLSSSLPSADIDVEYFGALEVAKRQHEILPALRILEPRLEKLSLVPLAGQLVIHGDISLPRLVPLPLMGEGMRHVLSIVLAIANAPGGVVLIDEVENGLHHSVMVQVWQAIAEAARRADVQVFATTHSYECIQAAHQAFAAIGNAGLRLFRLDRIKEEIRVAVYDQEILGFATEMSHEVR